MNEFTKQWLSRIDICSIFNLVDNVMNTFSNLDSICYCLQVIYSMVYYIIIP